MTVRTKPAKATNAKAQCALYLVAIVLSWGVSGPDARAQIPVPLTDPSCGGVLREVASMAALQEAIADVNKGHLKPGSVIRIKPNIYPVDRISGPLSVKDITDTTEECPITIEGMGASTVIDGRRQPGIERPDVEGIETLGIIDLIERTEELDAKKSTNTAHYFREDLVNCFKVKRSSWIVIRNLTIENCWPSALFIKDSRYVTLQDTVIIGSSCAVVAFGKSDHLLIERNDWTQDPSGDIWARIPWGVTHHGSRQYFNGAFLGGKNVTGGVVFRYNKLRNAYNGVRMKVDGCSRPAGCGRGMNVEIYNNSFRYIRDNPTEPESFAANWWIHHNEIYNAHAWFSFDGVRGGPFYVFGNTGWFDDVPARRCKDVDWANDRTATGKPTTGKECSASRVGKVLKLGNAASMPLYVFHNSWYLRSPIAGGGRSGPLRHWNNAIEYCVPLTRDQICQPRWFFSAFKGDEFIWDDESGYDFRHDLSNHPSFPNGLRAQGFPVDGLHAETVGFENPRIGNFALSRGSPAERTACKVSWSSQVNLVCATPPPDGAPDIGALQRGKPIKGPVYRHFDGPDGPDSQYVERPRIVDVEWGEVTNASLPIQITFSVPIAYADESVPVVLSFSGKGAYLETDCRIDKSEPAVLACIFADSRLHRTQAEKIFLPRNIVRRDGRRAPVTLWARADSRLGLMPRQ